MIKIIVSYCIFSASVVVLSPVVEIVTRGVVKAKPFFRWYDLWVGLYWDRKNKALYFLPLPMVGVKVFKQRPCFKGHTWDFEGSAGCPKSETGKGPQVCTRSLFVRSKCGQESHGDKNICENNCPMKGDQP